MDCFPPRPVMLVAHPRACSSAFERIFIQNQKDVICLHEPFGDAYWMGPERQLGRYEDLREASGSADATYKSVMDNIKRQNKLGHLASKRLFIKDMAFFLFPTPGKEPDIARSFGQQSQNESRNPTLLPKKELESFHFTFLIRDPRLSVPSYYRLSLPVHNGRSRVSKFTTDDLGYSELRRLFDYLLSERLIVPGWRGTAKWSRDRTPSLSDDSLSPSDTGSDDSSAEICVIDAEDLVHKPEAVISAYCQSTSIPYDAAMLYWGEANDQKRAEKVINQWGFDIYFHKAALESQSIRRDTKKQKDDEGYYEAWVAEFGIQGAEVIREAVNSQVKDYNYLKQFALIV